MIELVKQLYILNWDKATELAKELIHTKQEAETLASRLTRNKGWRERVTAAKIITAYNLKELAPDLVATFREGPEFYTCRAFSKMIVNTLGAAGVKLLEEMKARCPADGYGNNLVKVIDKEIEAIKIGRVD